MVYLEPDKDEMVFYLKLEKKRLLAKMENCLGDLERWEVKKKLLKVEKALDELLNQ